MNSHVGSDVGVKQLQMEMVMQSGAHLWGLSDGSPFACTACEFKGNASWNGRLSEL